MAEVVWLRGAENDLQSIFDYIVTENPSAAATYTSAIVEACQRLRDFPESGRKYNRRYRVLVVRNHIVFYRFGRKNALALIVAIVDGRRDIRSVVRKLSKDRI